MSGSAEAARSSPPVLARTPPESRSRAAGVPPSAPAAGPRLRDIPTARPASGRTCHSWGASHARVVPADALNRRYRTLDPPGRSRFRPSPADRPDDLPPGSASPLRQARDALRLPRRAGNLPASPTRARSRPRPAMSRAPLRPCSSRPNPLLVRCPTGEASSGRSHSSPAVSARPVRDETGRLAELRAGQKKHHHVPTSARTSPVALCPSSRRPSRRSRGGGGPSWGAAQEWEIICDVSRRIGRCLKRARPPAASPRTAPQLPAGGLWTCCLRSGPKGDLFGARRGGLSWTGCAARPNRRGCLRTTLILGVRPRRFATGMAGPLPPDRIVAR